MAEIKKTHIRDVEDENILVMRFDENPNIPSYKCNEATYKLIKEKLKKTAKAEKLKKFIDAELKEAKKTTDDNDLNMLFTLKGL